jgi:outer membrane beta-barrel protein
MMKKIFGNWGIQIGIVTFAVIWLALVAANWAESAELNPGGEPTAQKPDNSDSDYNFNWLDPEKKIYVLQNRKYTKADRAMISVMAGPGSGNAYRSVFNVDARLSYYISESWGLEGFYTKTFNTPNGNYAALENQASLNLSPFVREIKNAEGVMAEWVPWYAKINVFNSIIYFDWYFNLGLGSISAQDTYQLVNTPGSSATSLNESLLGIYWGTGHLYHLDQHWTVRLDVTSAVFHGANDPNGDKSWFSNYNFEAGLGYRF